MHILSPPLTGEAVDKGHFHPYEITHIQRMPQPDLHALGKEKIDRRYRETQWLKFIETIKIPISKTDDEQTEIPIVRRQLPERPRITNHAFRAGTRPVAAGIPKKLEDLAEARAWIFDLEWNWNAASQDELEIAVEYTQLSGVRTFSRVEPDLPTLLTGFVVALQEVWPDTLDRLASGTPVAEDLLKFIDHELGQLKVSENLSPFKSQPALPVDRILVKRDAGVWKAAWMRDEAGAELKAHSSHMIPESGDHIPVINAKYGQLFIVGIDILRFSQGQAKLDLYRNRNFKLHGTDVPTADAFVYHLGGIRGGEAVTPRLSSDAAFEGKKSQSLQAHVGEILSQLFPKEVDTAYQLYDLDLSEVTGAVSIGRPGTDGTAVLPQAFVVAGTTMPRISGLARGSGDDMTIAGAIKTWREDQGLVLPGSASPPDNYLRFAFRVYRDAAGPGGSSPILQISRIEIPLRLVTSLS